MMEKQKTEIRKTDQYRITTKMTNSDAEAAEVEDANRTLESIPHENVVTKIKIIKKEKKDGRSQLQYQTKKMSERQFSKAKIGESVNIRVPDDDRKRSGFRNIIGGILQEDPDGEMYAIRTKLGLLAQMYWKNQFFHLSRNLMSL